MGNIMDCEECVRLTSEYESLERTYAAAIENLTAGRSTVQAKEYQRLRKMADEARIDAEVARLELEKHQRVHR